MPSPADPGSVPAGPVRALGYIRVSTAREEMISPAIQRASIADFARRNGRVIVRWIEDLDLSGREFARREVMTGIARVEAGEAGEIIVYNYSRWGRNANDALANIKRVDKAGGAVVSVTEPFDAQTAIGKYSRTNALALAEMQSDIIGENWRAALSWRIQSGLPANGRPRFGYIRLGRVPREDAPHRYRKDPDDPGGERYVPDPVTGPVLAALYDRFNAGDGAGKLLAMLNGQGIRTANGETWGIKTLIMMMDSGFAAGLLRVHNPRCQCAARARCRDVTYLPGAHEPLITAETWEKYRARRARMRDVPPRTRVPAYPLTGLMRCGTCKGMMVATFGRGRAGYAYRCASNAQHRGCAGAWVRRSVAEAAVLEFLRGLSDEAGTRAAAVKARARVVADADKAKERLTADLAEADRKLRRLLLLAASAADDKVPGEVWQEAKAALLADRARAEAALAAAVRSAEANRGDYLPVARDLLATWDLIPPPRRRDMLAAVVARVVVTRAAPRTPPRIDVIPVWEETAGQGR